MNTETTLGLVRAYYESWPGGNAGFDDPRLRSVLDPALSFVSPLSDKDRVADFLEGLHRFSKTLKGRNMLQLVASGNEAAALYECELVPASESPSTLRCGEFFRIEGERITAIRLVFDATPFKLKA